MNVDLIVASSIFIIFVSAILFYFFGFQKQGPSWQSLIELRKEASKLANEIISKGIPSDWNKENIIPSKIGLASSYYLIPILISDTSGYNRINEPIAQEIVFDNDCKNLAWNGTVRIFDENFNEVPFRFVNQTFCPSGFLQKAILFFEVNVSANSTRKLQIFFYNSTQVNPKDYGNFSNLVMWLTFDEGSGNIAYDYSGNKNNGVLLDANVTNNDGNTPPQWTNGKFGKALSFDGVDDYVGISASPTLNITNQITIEAWVLPLSFGGNPGRGILRKGDDSYAYELVVNSDGYPQLWLYSGTDNGLTATQAISLNSWNFIVGTYNNSNMKLYINENLVGERAIGSITILNNNQILTIGAWDLGYLRHWNGTIDEVRVYNRALTNEEILSHYQQPLTIKIFPRTEVSLISFEKIEALRNISYDLLKNALQKGYNFRVEVYEK
ncbi:MAG: LamG domain-containing protein [Candidatus Aenigmarchaeota archaeon]|nr:LamG domain-containing protein [Candidatus Aenigmarchaeota archaeon]